MVDESKSSFEELSLNCDIMLPIFKMLNFKDQLRFSHASATLQHIFELFICPGNYKNMKIISCFVSNFAVTNGEKFLFLSQEELNEFLHYYAYRTQKLVLPLHMCIYPSKYWTHFKNLISLELDDFFLEEFDSLATTVLSNLECLKIGRCWGSEIKSVLPLKKLKTLHLRQQYDGVTNEMLWKILNLPKLESLSLFCYITDKDVLIDSNKPCSSQLKKLDIPTVLGSSQWCQSFFIETFFENLVSLTLSSERLRNETLNMIASTCKKLQTYAIHKTTFISIEDFILPKNVLELSIKRCEGLTRTNLRQILTETGITKFFTSGTTYSGDFEDFPLSPSIVTFHMFDHYEGENEKFITFYTNKHLKDLRCGSLLSDTVLGLHDKLEKLHLNDPIPLGPLQLLTNLQKLKLEWIPKLSSLIDLLRHPFLKHLCMLGATSPIFDAILPADLKTNVNCLETCTIGYTENDEIWLNLWMDFWLDLFNLTSMTLKFRTNNGPLFVNLLIRHEKFPRELKNIYLFGLPVESKTLKDDNCGTMNMLKFHSSWMLDSDIMLCPITS